MKILWLLALAPAMFPRENAGEGGDEGEGGDGGTPPGADTGQTFNQAQVNDIVVKRNKAVRAQLETVEKNYEKLLESTNLTHQQKEELESQLEAVQSQLRTKEQQAAHEAKQLQSKFSKQLEETTVQLTRYKTMFETSTRDRAIVTAAADNDAFNPEQFISILADRTQLVEEVNAQGEKTGNLVPRIRVTEKGEDGTPIEVLKTPEEAIVAMKQDVTRFGNLFRSNVAKGIGEGNSNSAAPGSLNPAKMTDEEYFANQAAIRSQLGIRPRRTI